jgi:hypothetical protein
MSEENETLKNGTTGHHNYDLLANTKLNTHPAGDIIQKRLSTVMMGWLECHRAIFKVRL